MNHSEDRENKVHTTIFTEVELRQKRELSNQRMLTLQHHVFVCNGGCCIKNGSEEVLQAFRNEVTAADALDRIRITETMCTGRCADACSVVVYPEGIWYRLVTKEMVKTIVDEHLLKGNVVAEQVSYFYENGRFSDRLER